MANINNIIEIISKLKNTSGSKFFDVMTEQLYYATEADYTFIARLERNLWQSRTVSLFAKGKHAENFAYDLRGTPCEEVACDSTYACKTHVTQLFPKDELLIEMNIEGYLGAPLHSTEGEVFGIVVALYENPIKELTLVQSLFELFSGRIAAEIERTEQHNALEALNKNLEDKINERTQELEHSLVLLKQNQEKMIEQERLASLSNIVVGVAHEMNKPLGNALLTTSNILEHVKQIYQKVKSNKLSRKSLEDALSSMEQSSNALEGNLTKTVKLIDNFTQIATEIEESTLASVQINDWLNKQCDRIQELLKDRNIRFINQISKDQITLSTYPDKLSQAFVSLVQNVMIHAFPAENNFNNKTITIISGCQNDHYFITISDNGIGIKQEHLEKIFDPFFTTSRHLGQVGLGLSVVNSIVVQVLNGTLSAKSKVGEGTSFTIAIPISIEEK